MREGLSRRWPRKNAKRKVKRYLKFNRYRKTMKNYNILRLKSQRIKEIRLKNN